MKEQVLIAMSGGVDSSVAAYLMKEQGYDCIGAMMLLHQSEPTAQGMRTSSGQPAEKASAANPAEGKNALSPDAEDAKAVAQRLSMPFYCFDLSEEFRREVIERFVRTYEQGGTPNPCVSCNRYLKFGALLREAERLSCTAIATGHYARIVPENGRWLLKKALNPEKDQSYVLYSLTQRQLARTRLPLGELTKERVREIAHEQGFLNAQKQDSQDICFVPDGDYAAVIRRFSGKDYPSGDFVDAEGRVLGTHKGIIHYTVGQRKGLGLALSEPHYVCRKDAARNRVVLGKNADLFSRSLDAEDANWIVWDTPPARFRAKARIRYQQTEQWATVFPDGADRFRLEFDEPQRAIAAGQSVVLYDGDTVIGGGIIRQ